MTMSETTSFARGRAARRRTSRKGAVALWLGGLALVSGCVFVDVSEEARVVTVVTSEDEVAACEKKGTVGARTRARVGYARRSEETVALELERIARNEAVSLGANTLVPQGPVEEGRRRYDAYLCPE